MPVEREKLNAVLEIACTAPKETLKKSIHGFFQLVLSKRMSATDSANQRRNALIRVGASCPKRETLNHSAFP
jgi:hypothetical protein